MVPFFKNFGVKGVAVARSGGCYKLLKFSESVHLSKPIISDIFQNSSCIEVLFLKVLSAQIFDEAYDINSHQYQYNHLVQR